MNEFDDDDDMPMEALELYGELRNEEREHGFSAEQLRELKDGGFARPPGVPWSEWVSNKKLSHRHELIIHLAARGLSLRMIAEELGMTKERVGELLRAPEIRSIVSLKQKEIYGDAPKKRLQDMSNKALETLNNILDNEQEKSSLKADVAKYVVDQSVGKATQTHEVTGNLLNELIVRLDAEKSRVVSGETEKLAKPLDSLEAFVETHVPSNVKVGNRGTGQENG